MPRLFLRLFLPVCLFFFLQFLFNPVPVVGFPAGKIAADFLLRYPYPCRFYPFHDSGNNFPVIPLVRLMSFFKPKTAVFLIQP